MNKFLLTAIPFALALTAQAQQGKVFTAADYQRAESAMAYANEPLVERKNIRPTWLPDERYYYRTTAAEGNQFCWLIRLKAQKP
ncbi:hypothetical protein [Mucilaginibacter antarcticus]|uniref:hypothetical protein n=1 Tax=Mucilaginibacter antarcticus TaxID=1855725 RepID=UPI0036263D5B